MIRCALLAALVLVVAPAASAQEPSDHPQPVGEHADLSRAIPMAIVGSTFLRAGTAGAYFQALEAGGFACEAEDITRWRVRRVRVSCARPGEALVYEGGFPPDRASVVFDRVARNGTLLAGSALARHVQAVLAAGPGPQGPERAVAELARPAR